ncbi:MAG: DDE-type integrase/transposase/recombinase, partial [Calditrichaeota bacterium]|nr:DDE-type integrase/transposase/recombinase [Calditrichota bacterium]
MSIANNLWGAPRIHGELLKLGFEVSQATVRRYMKKHIKPPSQTWRTFLTNHMHNTASIDFFVVPTITFKLLFVLVVLSHDRRKIVHFNVTASPSAAWTGQQIIEAFPWDNAPKYMIRDNDSIYGADFKQRVNSAGIKQVRTAFKSPWQNAYCERVIGS